ncbi:TetR/AcrR family transcriptional regulator [Nocardia sp. XZ_19_385]|uniref:TetR/AcrR family transcriptional regulator n=1 Tax=Nocardia sp. XZ_19_385 TaxID=2769488 RepID=UPI00188FA22F|nr:TetR/AcrR family transcriptional regulator [Nocardia sp. XZ_19_385]
MSRSAPNAATSARPISVWERKKLQAMREIQRAALDLFDEQGFRAVTVEQVAAASHVSPSSIYRYFGTKEALILWDEYDPKLIELLSQNSDQVVTPQEFVEEIRESVPALIRELAADEERIRRRMRYVASEPDVRDGLARETRQLEDVLRRVVGARIGRDPADLQIRLLAAMLAWGFDAALDYWMQTDFDLPLAEALAYAIEALIRSAEAVLGFPAPAARARRKN